MLNSMRDGRATKGTLVCHAGKEGNEGKSFLLQPLISVFGEDLVFGSPPKNAFPLMGLESHRLVLLDDWRFNESILSFNVQLLWFEGKSIVIARPQNQPETRLNLLSVICNSTFSFCRCFAACGMSVSLCGGQSSPINCSCTTSYLACLCI